MRTCDFISDETAMSIPAPVLAMINSTAISITLPSAPYLPPLDSWTYITNHEVRYYKVGDESNVHTITVTGSLPQTVIASRLGKYTDYQFFVHYFGKIGSADQNIVSPGAIQKTDEDGEPCIENNIFFAGKLAYLQFLPQYLLTFI